METIEVAEKSAIKAARSCSADQETGIAILISPARPPAAKKGRRKSRPLLIQHLLRKTRSRLLP